MSAFQNLITEVFKSLHCQCENRTDVRSRGETPLPLSHVSIDLSISMLYVFAVVLAKLSFGFCHAKYKYILFPIMPLIQCSCCLNIWHFKTKNRASFARKVSSTLPVIIFFACLSVYFTERSRQFILIEKNTSLKCLRAIESMTSW